MFPSEIGNLPIKYYHKVSKMERVVLNKGILVWGVSVRKFGAYLKQCGLNQSKERGSSPDGQIGWGGPVLQTGRYPLEVFPFN